MATARVLILDSDTDCAGEIASRAKSDQWQTVLAIGVEGALKALADPTPAALALVDRGLWGDSGLRSALTAEDSNLPVIVLTEHDAPEDTVVQQLRLGAASYVPRNAASRRLVDTIHTIISLSLRNPYRERIREYLRSGEVELQIGNDPKVIPLIVGYAQRVLEDYGLISGREQTRVGVAISEAISNAMIHGNLEVASDLRDAMTDAYYDLISARMGCEPYLSRKVHVVMRFSQSSLTVVVRDQGKGFDRAAIADPTAQSNIEVPSGRGVLLMRAYTDALSWNDTGNEVTLTKVFKH